MTGKFVHLHVHSDFSFARGVSKVEALINAAAAHGQPAIALTDTDVMHGAFDFSKAALKTGVQPIVGVKLHLRVDDETRGSIILLAMSDTGYRNICTLLASAQSPFDADGERRQRPLDLPLVSGQMLQEYAEDVILLTGGSDGILSRMISNKDPAIRANLSSAFDYLRYCFCDRFFIEICRNGSASADDVAVEEALLDLAYSDAAVTCMDGVERRGAPVVATTEVYYTSRDRHDAFEITRAVEAKRTVAAQGDVLLRDDPLDYHLRSSEEMRELFADLPEAIANTEAIAIRCAFAVEPRNPILPPFPTTDGRTEAEELREHAMKGLAERLTRQRVPEEDHAAYYERLAFELDVIIKMDFPGYFLIVADFIKWATAQGIPVGPGRGSGAGSMVAWALTITDLDPLRFGLLFERFLNPERVSMPDFDIDFCQDRRGEVIRYVQEKYGHDLVSAIVTFMVCKSKTALRDTGRVLTHDRLGGYSRWEVESLTKLIPQMPGEADPMTLDVAFSEVPELRDRKASDSKVRMLFDYARQIEGTYRTSSAHAAGVIIGGRPLYELVPTGWDNEAGMPITQFNMKGAESCGLVKFDFLGLKTLSVLKEATRLIQETSGETVDLSDIPMDDPRVLQLFAEGDTNGIFQFESDGMKSVLLSVKPSRIEDLIAVNALYRPGPMDQIPLFAACKNGEEEPHYPKPVDRTRPFLEETYGIMVYQEQVMKVAQEVAGYTLGGADILRRAMGKKIKSEMDRERNRFVTGAVERGATQEEAEALFDHIAKFAGYGFNKSHAAAYTVIAYRAAWLKTYHPVAFFAALLTYETSNPDRMALFKSDMDNRGIPLLPPDINKSFARFYPEKIDGTGREGVRFGFSGLKGFSQGLEDFEKLRAQCGGFVDYVDYDRKAKGAFNKKQLECLASVGAFDALGGNRRQAFSILSWLAANKPSGNTNGDLFGSAAPVTIPSNVTDVPDWGDIADREFQSVGFYFNKHPLDRYLPRLFMAGVRRRQSYRDYMSKTKRGELVNRYFAGMAVAHNRRLNRNGIPYVRVTIAEKAEDYWVDFYETRECKADDLCSLIAAQIENKKPIAFVADLIRDSGGLFMKGSRIWDIDEFLQKFRGDFLITFDASKITPTYDERRLLKEIENTKGQADITLSQARVRSGMIERKLTELREHLAQIAVPDDAKHGTSISVVINVPGQAPQSIRLPGRYMMTLSCESLLKSMDGLIDLKEVFSDEIMDKLYPSRKAGADGEQERQVSGFGR